MTKGISLTTQVHQIIQQNLSTGELAIDATVGNGHDTLFLSSLVGNSGLVFGFDVQQQAIDATQEKLNNKNSADNTQLFHCSHCKMEQQLATEFHGRIKVIMFNLGYLPGSDKSVITQADSSLAALNQSLKLLTNNGLITIAAYPGHSGGDIETQMVEQWCEQLSAKHYKFELILSSDKPTAPRLFVIKAI